jgi:DNA-binding FadR family transcriptional regulator
LNASVQEIIEVFEAREAIEGMAARLVARRGLNASEAESLRALAQSIDRYLMDERQIPYERQFHQRVVELSGNRLLIRMYDLVMPVLMGRLPPDRPGQAPLSPPPPEMRQMHTRLVDVLLKGNEEDAERAFRQHCNRVISFVTQER